MALRENTDYVLLKDAALVGDSIMDQHKGSLLATKNLLMLVVSHNMDLMQTAFGDDKHKDEYRDDQTLNPFKNLANAAHNVKVSTQELKESINDNKEFRKQERKVKEVHKSIEETIATAGSVEALEAAIKTLCLENEQSLVLPVDQIYRMNSGFFKVGFAGCKILMRDGRQLKIICRKVSRAQQFIGK
jgi:hypothetical protein